MLRRPPGGMVDATDLKSGASAWGFESPGGHSSLVPGPTPDFRSATLNDVANRSPGYSVTDPSGYAPDGGETAAARLAVLDSYEVLDTPREPAFDALVALVADLCAVPIVAIGLLDERRQWFKAETGLGVREIQRDLSICAVTSVVAGMTVIPDLHDDPRFDGNGFVHGPGAPRFYAGVTLETTDGVTLGTLLAVDTKPRPGGLTPAQTFAMTSLASQVMAQLELRRALREREFEVRHRRSVEQALRDSREQLDVVVNQARIGIAQLDPAGRFILVNDEVCAISGRTRTALLGMRINDLCDPTDQLLRDPAFDAMLADGPPVRGELQLLRPGGDEVLVEVTLSPVGVPNEDRVLIAVIRDVTDQRAAEAAVRQSEARFRGAVEATSGVLWTNDAEGRMTGDQPGWSALTGQTREQYQGYGWTAAVHPDDAALTVARWEQAVASRSPFVFEHRLRRADGSWRLFSIRAVPTADLDGHLREWVGVHTDITEARETAAALERLNERLEAEVEARTRERDRIWRATQELIAVCSFDSVMLRANHAWGAALGWTSEAIRGMPLTDLIHPDEREVTGALLAELAVKPGVRQIESRVRTAAGAYRRIAWNATSDQVAIYAIGRDVTAERDADEALRRTEEQLRQSQKMEAVGQLTGGIAHDFNNLLTAIVGSIELARARVDGGRPGDVVRLLDNAMTAATRAGSLTHRLLAFARRQALDPSRIDIAALIESVRGLICGTMGESTTVEMVLKPDLWPVLCDANQLENALLNLAINARDAMPEGGVFTIAAENRTIDADRAAELGGLAMGDYVAVTVSDTGCGIAPDLRERVFEPFFTTKPIGQGTGLGLSQLYGFVKQSNGHVELDSTEGAGTRFTLWLPRAIATDPLAASSAGDARAGEPIRGTVLVVEDEASVRDLIVEVLDGMGLRALQAGDGPAGLTTLDGPERIELLITDVGLPGLNGRQMAEMARANRPGLPVLFITGYAPASSDSPEALPERTSVLGKPFTLQALEDRVAAMLRSAD